jgi:hypothetical protein
MNTASKRDFLERTNNGTSFVGSDINIYRCHVVALALRLYAKTGMKANRAYTPTAMLRVAMEETGERFTGKDKYLRAADALDAKAHAAKERPCT